MHIPSCLPSLCPAWLLSPTETVIHKKEMEFLLPCTSYAIDRQWWGSGYRSWITQTQDSALKPHVAQGPLGSWLYAPLRDAGPRKVDDLSAIVMGMGLQASSNMCTCITYMCTCTHVPLASLIPALEKKNTFLLRSWRSGLKLLSAVGVGGSTRRQSSIAIIHPPLGQMLCFCLRSLVCWVWQQQRLIHRCPPGWPSCPNRNGPSRHLHVSCTVQKATGCESAAQTEPKEKPRG